MPRGGGGGGSKGGIRGAGKIRRHLPTLCVEFYRRKRWKPPKTKWEHGKLAAFVALSLPLPFPLQYSLRLYLEEP